MYGCLFDGPVLLSACTDRARPSKLVLSVKKGGMAVPHDQTSEEHPCRIILHKQDVSELATLRYVYHILVLYLPRLKLFTKFPFHAIKAKRKVTEHLWSQVKMLKALYISIKLWSFNFRLYFITNLECKNKNVLSLAAFVWYSIFSPYANFITAIFQNFPVKIWLMCILSQFISLVRYFGP